MKIKSTFPFLFIINVWGISNIYAQDTPTSIGTVSGSIHDSKTSEAIEYGTVAVITANAI